MRRGWLAGLAAAGLAVGPAGAELPRHRVKPCPLPGIPDYDYKPADARAKPTVTAISLIKVPAAPPAPAEAVQVVPVVGAPGAPIVAVPAVPAAQVYQMKETRLQIDHCFLSRVAVTLHQDGLYQISFRADQNPQPTGDIRSPLRPGERVETMTTLQTGQLRRNLFTVKVRGYGVFPTLGQRPSSAAGQPVLFELPVEQFWVQRGEPYSGFFEGRYDSVRRFIGLTDRVEIEFTYK